MTCETIMQVMSALLTPLIALIAVYIAWQQHLTNSRQLKLALYDRRVAVFNSTMELIGLVVKKARIDEISALVKFLVDTREHEFLFDSDIKEYLQALSKKAADLYGRNPVQPELAGEYTELLKWFIGQSEEAIAKFGKYMSFPEP
jgi:hypothetical protein